MRVPRRNNGKADALAKIAKELASKLSSPITVLIQNRQILSPADLSPANEETSHSESTLIALQVDEAYDWRKPFFEYLQCGKLPREPSLASQVKKRALSFAFVNNTLYRRSFHQLWLRCLGKEEAQKVMGEVHSGLCGAHQSGPKMKLKIQRLGYYWPTMTQDCVNHARRCHQCQVHGTVLHQPPNPLHPTVVSWPFESWGTDVVGPIDPPSSKGHRFILAGSYPTMALPSGVQKERDLFADIT